MKRADARPMRGGWHCADHEQWPQMSSEQNTVNSAGVESVQHQAWPAGAQPTSDQHQTLNTSTIGPSDHRSIWPATRRTPTSPSRHPLPLLRRIVDSSSPQPVVSRCVHRSTRPSVRPKAPPSTGRAARICLLHPANSHAVRARPRASSGLPSPSVPPPTDDPLALGFRVSV